MKCPFCGSEETQVKDSRPAEEGLSVRRRRICTSCSSRYTTYERVQLRDLTVVKSDGRRQPFSRDKLLSSMITALRKRDFDLELLECLVNAITRQLEITSEGVIHTTRIGELVMENLRGIDKIAYIRFASVYKDFKETQDFQELLGEVDQIAQRAAE